MARSRRRKPSTTGKGERPLGVTIVVALSILAAVYLLLVAFILGAIGILSGLVGAIAGFSSNLLIVSAIVLLIFAYGFWDGAPWGWWLGIIVSGILIISVAFLDVLGFVFGLMLVYYLTRPNVKKWFRVS